MHSASDFSPPARTPLTTGNVAVPEVLLVVPVRKDKLSIIVGELFSELLTEARGNNHSLDFIEFKIDILAYTPFSFHVIVLMILVHESMVKEF